VEIDYSSQWTNVANLLSEAENVAEARKKQAVDEAERRGRQAAQGPRAYQEKEKETLHRHSYKPEGHN
jgi:hypothetical protein